MLWGYIVKEFPIIAVLSLLIGCPIIAWDKYRHRIRPATRYIVLYAFIGYSLSLLYLTVLWYYPNITFHPKYRFLNLKPFIWVRETYDMGFKKMIQQLFLNVAMFIPYGFLLPMVFKKLRNVSWQTLTVFVTTFSIEALQYLIGRSADVDDVIMNCLGGALGYLCFKLVHLAFSRKHWWKNAIDS